MIRKHIIFTGLVQGVGFRYWARRAAQMYDCTGWCRNERDGSVVMEIQGTEENIDKVIRSVGRAKYVRIMNIDSKVIPVKPDDHGFRTS